MVRLPVVRRVAAVVVMVVMSAGDGEAAISWEYVINHQLKAVFRSFSVSQSVVFFPRAGGFVQLLPGLSVVAGQAAAGFRRRGAPRAHSVARPHVAGVRLVAVMFLAVEDRNIIIYEHCKSLWCKIVQFLYAQ